MKNKLTLSQKRLLLCLVIALIFAAAYQFGYTKLEKMAQDYQNKTTVAKQQIQEINSELAQEDTIADKTKKVNDQVNDIIDAYPVNITKEDDLVFIQKVEQDLGIDIPSVNVLDNSVFYTTILPIRDENGKEITITDNNAAPAATQGAAADTGNTVGTNSTTTAGTGNTTAPSTDTSTATGTGSTSDSSATSPQSDAKTDISSQYMTGLVSQISINFTISESDFIKLVKYLDHYPQRTSIGNTSLSYDASTGELTGSMTINRYALTGTGKIYQEPDLGNISVGTDNLFGTKSK